MSSDGHGGIALNVGAADGSTYSVRANMVNYQKGAIWNGQSGNLTAVGSVGAATACY